MAEFNWIIYSENEALEAQIFQPNNKIKISRNWQECLNYEVIVCVENTRAGLFVPSLDGFQTAYIDFNLSRKDSGANPLLKALGKKRERILDVTAGWGQDALNAAQHGSNVTALESSDIMICLLKNAFLKTQNAALATRLDFLHVDAKDWLNNYNGDKYDVIYLDPMYPEKRKNAATRKHMYFLQHFNQLGLLSTKCDASLLKMAQQQAKYRVVVKRPNHAPPLADGRSGFTQGKLVRFDIYAPI